MRPGAPIDHGAIRKNVRETATSSPYEHPRKRTAMKAQPKGKKNRPPHPGEAERIAQRRLEVLKLRLQGLYIPAIARALKVDKSTVSRDLQAEYAENRAQRTALAEDAREVELLRLDRWQAQLEASGLTVGDPRAVHAAVRISERRARLLGLDAPTKLAGPTGGAIEHAILYIPDNGRKTTA